MPKSADIGSKRLISLAPQRWVQWVTQIPDVQIREIITSEFQWISRESDVLVSAYTPEDGEFLVLNELQLRYKAQMPQRMRAYAALAEEHYNKPTYPVLINILPPATSLSITNRYESEFRGLIARQDYHVINLWEVEAEIAFQQPLTSLIPFVPILKGGGEELVVRQALQFLRSDEKLNDLEPLLAFFASFVLEIPLVQQIMRWDMAVLHESPWYQQILQQGMQQGMQQGIQQGMQQGIQQGIQQGMQQGLKQGLLSGIALGLELKFGAEGLELMPEIRQILDVAKLEAIQSAIKTVNSLDELRQSL
ncbi:Rpn family recombination-promoting nuclease/putative transposase [Floridanema evergladense]|uniref:Rpn family recombination-promoting nuclease/putative transposase n=1 Tax=Floridaenema evergladense BLCC-F167 TaxID=3153639 RepID=A0ABV4WWD3_9CYAN